MSHTQVLLSSPKKERRLSNPCAGDETSTRISAPHTNEVNPLFRENIEDIDFIQYQSNTQSMDMFIDTEEFPSRSNHPSKPQKPSGGKKVASDIPPSEMSRSRKPDRRSQTQLYPGIPWGDHICSDPWLAWATIERHLMGWGISYAVIKVVRAWCDESIFKYGSWGREQTVCLTFALMAEYSLSAVALHQVMLKAKSQGVIDLVEHIPGRPGAPAQYFVRLRSYIEEEEQPELSEEDIDEIREAELLERGRMLMLPDEEELGEAVAIVEAELVAPVSEVSSRRNTGPLTLPKETLSDQQTGKIAPKEISSNDTGGTEVPKETLRNYEVPSHLHKIVKVSLSKDGGIDQTLKETLNKLAQKREGTGFHQFLREKAKAAQEADLPPVDEPLKETLSTPLSISINRFDNNQLKNITNNNQIDNRIDKQSQRAKQDDGLRMLMQDGYNDLVLQFGEILEAPQHQQAINHWVELAKRDSRLHKIPIDQLYEALAAKLQIVQMRRNDISEHKRREYWFKCAVNMVKQMAAKAVTAVAMA